MAADQAQQTRVHSSRLQHFALAYWESAALMSAVDLGVFTVVSEGASTVETVAESVQISITNADRLVAVLRAMDLLHEVDGKLVNAADTHGSWSKVVATMPARGFISRDRRGTSGET